jgi:hypothetical protein
MLPKRDTPIRQIQQFGYTVFLVHQACATLAQSVERLTRNEQVDSSILSSGSIALDVGANAFAA